jgi:hypothetical protein
VHRTHYTVPPHIRVYVPRSLCTALLPDMWPVDSHCVVWYYRHDGGCGLSIARSLDITMTQRCEGCRCSCCCCRSCRQWVALHHVCLLQTCMMYCCVVSFADNQSRHQTCMHLGLDRTLAAAPGGVVRLLLATVPSGGRLQTSVPARLSLHWQCCRSNVMQYAITDTCNRPLCASSVVIT